MTQNRKRMDNSRWGAVLLMGVALVVAQASLAQDDRISRFGQYQGYSQQIYDGYVRTSQYVPMRDGTLLAVDIFRPTLAGQVATEPLPVVWAHERYQRASVTISPSGTRVIAHKLAKEPWLQTLVKYGYVVAVADARGTGASFGTQRGPFSPIESQDAYDLNEWLAVQPWSSGRTGMFGSSYLCTTQYMATVLRPPHLFAIFPDVGLTDLYQFAYGGGIYKESFMFAWGGLTKTLDLNGAAAPVDGDENGILLAQACAQHVTNGWVHEFFQTIPCRDSWDAGSNGLLWQLNSPMSYLSNIAGSGVAIYHWAGWFDAWPRDQIVLYSNLSNPQRITIGPWCHKDGRVSPEYLVEHLRWYDYWLKKIDNGVLDDNPIVYGTIGAPASEQWKATNRWPLENAHTVKYYLSQGSSGSVSSVNDGCLAQCRPHDPDGRDDYTVNYTTTSGLVTRWTALYKKGFGYPNMAPNDVKALTYTTEPLAADTKVTGHPVVSLWITSTAADGDFVVYLEEVDENGVSNYVTEGAMRASHRSLSEPDYEYLDLPYHRSYAADIADLPDRPVMLRFDLHPTSNLFDAGHRIRVTVAGADIDTYKTPVLSPAPVVSIYRNQTKASYVQLPIENAGGNEE